MSANRTRSLAFGPSPFINDSCYLKSLYPQHFFTLSFEDDFSLLHAITGTVPVLILMSMKCWFIIIIFFAF